MFVVGSWLFLCGRGSYEEPSCCVKNPAALALLRAVGYHSLFSLFSPGRAAFSHHFPSIAVCLVDAAWCGGSCCRRCVWIGGWMSGWDDEMTNKEEESLILIHTYVLPKGQSPVLGAPPSF